MNLVADFEKPELREVPHIVDQVLEQPGQQTAPQMGQFGRDRIPNCEMAPDIEPEACRSLRRDERIVVDFCKALIRDHASHLAQVTCASGSAEARSKQRAARWAISP